jgi:hypothetical protein
MRKSVFTAKRTLQFKDKQVLSKGYGYIASSVMESEEVTVGAKCLYAYFISKTGVSEFCYPSNKTIMKSLGIKNKSTLNNYKIELEAHGLLRIEERKYKSGRVASNRYYPAKLKLEKQMEMEE